MSLSDSLECPAGFRAAAAASGIKTGGALDLALIEAPDVATAAGLFTRNRFAAAPVLHARKALASTGGAARAVLVNAGCANAGTGPRGEADVATSAAAVAAALDCSAAQVLIASTGPIGPPLPIDRLTAAIPSLAGAAHPRGLGGVAEAILTTDTCTKTATRSIEHDGRTVTVAGVAKGSGMIHPDMATMIAVLLTDAAIDAPALDGLLREAADASFHRISVDGDTSTNDTVLALASGAAGPVPPAVLAPALVATARELALMIVRDGEGASRMLHVTARGAATPVDARLVAETVATSSLVRTAVAGASPNWGRILAAAGRSGAALELDRVSIEVGDIAIIARGAPQPVDAAALDAAVSGRDVAITVDLGLGDGEDDFYACDLTEGYVRINTCYS